MINILYKEIKLSSSPLTFFFIAFSFMFFIPGYPILCGVFFVCLGIFKSFESIVETNDIVFSCLLPVSKKEIVMGKYLFTCLIELCSLTLMGIVVIIRNTLLLNSAVYRNNFMMNANYFALGIAFVIFALFNLIFIGGFFKTTYKRTKPFVYYLIANFIVIGIAESMHHIPSLTFLNSFGNDYLVYQLLLLLVGILIYVVVTYFSFKLSCKRFERIDI